MEALRIIGKTFMIGALLVLIYDLINGWLSIAALDIRSLSEWWTSIDAASLSNAKAFLSAHLKSSLVDKLFKLPGFIAVFVPGIFFYLLYRIIFAVKGGKSGGRGGFTYRSRD